MKDAGAEGKKKGDAKADKKGDAKKGEEEAAAAPPPPKPLAVLRANQLLIEKAVAQKEARMLFGRVLRQTAGVRKRMAAADVSAFVEGALPADAPARAALLDALSQVSDDAAMEEADGPTAGGDANGAAPAADAAPPAKESPPPPPSSLPEVEAYCYLLATMLLTDRRLYEQVPCGAGL